MTNDISTLTGALQELGEKLADNLNSMGVTDADATDGLTTLANKVLDISPTLTGVELSTALTCILSNQSIGDGDSIGINGVLTASYDDTTQTNVDLNGYLQGATIKIYEGNTVVGTAITNNNGVYNYSYAPATSGDYIIHSEFEGTIDYDDCVSSNNNLTVEALLCNGFADTYPFTIFTGRNLSATTVTDNSITQTSGNKGGGHTSTTIFEEAGNYEVSFRITESTITASNGVRVGIHSANTDVLEQSCIGLGYSGDTNTNINFDYADSDVSTVTKLNTGLTSLSNGDIVKFRIIGNTLTAYINNTSYLETTMTWLHEPMWFYVQSWGSGTASISIDNFKVRKIPIVLEIDNLLLSQQNNDTATLTVTLNGENVSNKPVEFFKNGVLIDTVRTNSSGVATKTYVSNGEGDFIVSAGIGSLKSEEYYIEDCIYYDTTTYSSNTDMNISLPSNFKLEFDLYPKTRSTSNGGASHYIKCSRVDSATDIWFGQGTSGGSHGIMVRPSTNYWVTNASILNTDNHVLITYNGNNIVYACNNESKSIENTIDFDKLYGVGVGNSSNCVLKNIKLKPLLFLSANKQVLSYYDNDTTTLIAKLNGYDISGKTVEFFKNNVSIGTSVTDENGVATKVYESVGDGNVSFRVEYDNSVSNICTIEDCVYYNTSEVTRTTTNGSTIYDNNLSQTLPTNCEISFDFWSNNSNKSEHRFFLLPKSQFSTGTTQPQYALYVDQLGSNKGYMGKRENNSTIAMLLNFDLNGSTWHTIKWVKNNTSVDFYMDTTLKGNQTLSWIDNYSDWCFSMMRWSSSGTSIMKNVKIKAV